MREWLVAAGLIEGPDGLLLVQNRRRDGTLDWSPPGGVIEVQAGETVRDGLTREVAEETGLIVSEWDGPAYEVDVVAEGLGWTLHVEAYRARSFEGELAVRDPDGIVVDARFVLAAEWGRHFDGAHPWVREPVVAFLDELETSTETRFRYRLDGPPGLLEVVRLHGRRTPDAEPRTILHVDMDAFYVSVELLVDPSLAGQPVIVGGSGNRGVVASCSYEARAYGIHSAMPSARARRLCPQAVFVPGHYDLYSDYSRRIHEVFEATTPLVEGISLDEAFLDVTGARRLLGDGPQIAAAVRARIAAELGLAASVGVATSKFLAKLASKAAKPSASRQGAVPGAGAGVVVVEPGEELAFLHPLAVQALWGVGPATYRRLERFGVRTVGELAAIPLGTLTGALGQALGQHLHDLSWARDTGPVEPSRAVKSIGHEETYARDIHDLGALHAEAVRLADAVATRLRRAALAGRTVTIKVRFHDFATITRSHTFPAAVDTGPAIARAATALLDTVDPGPGVRLFGISMSNLGASGPADARQLTLDDAGDATGDADVEWERASSAVDAVRRRFGDRAVGPAALVGRDGLRVKRQGDTQWGPSGPAGGLPSGPERSGGANGDR